MMDYFKLMNLKQLCQQIIETLFRISKDRVHNFIKRIIQLMNLQI
jgi:hypothetical protein